MISSTPLTTRLRHQLQSRTLREAVSQGRLTVESLARLDVLARLYTDAWAPDVAPWLAAAIHCPQQGHVGVRINTEHWRALGSVQPQRLAELSCVTALSQANQDAAVQTPFVLFDDPQSYPEPLLMTQRLWRTQKALVNALTTLMSTSLEPIDHLETKLDALYGSDSSEAKRAAALVANNRFAVINGGPGTGKTWGIKRILALLLSEAHRNNQHLEICLTAPTGKAAVRLKEAIGEQLILLRDCGVDERVIDQLTSLVPSTLHRALGSNPAQPQRFRRGADLPLGADVVVVDEASMVDINVMRHLCEAVAMGPGRLILLGDPDQLTSVGAGSVLSDLVAAHQSGQSSLEQQIATLKTSHRFAQAASINCVATLLQTHQSDAIALAFDLFRAIASKDPRWRSQCLADPLEADGQPRRFVWQKTTTSALSSTQLDELATGYLARSQSQYPRRAPGPIWQILEAIDADEDLSDPHVQQRCLQSLHNYRVLCAHRNGPRGVQGINEALSARARALLGSRATMTPSGHWLGQPIMITRNADDLGLRNGDVGLILPNAQGSLCALFARNDEIEHISLAALPAHQSAFAMSIHKSQGSQFGHVAIVLPAKVGSAVCTRELIYTALTRAQHDVSWYGSEAVLKDALSKRASRNSALVSLLRLPTAT